MNDKAGGALGLAVLVGVIWYNSEQSDVWTAYYYPDRSNLSRHIGSPAFKTLEECRQWVDGTYKSRGSEEPFDFEYGLNCRAKDGLNLCEETRR